MCHLYAMHSVQVAHVRYVRRPVDARNSASAAGKPKGKHHAASARGVPYHNYYVAITSMFLGIYIKLIKIN